jgi:protein disulfide-isomerase
MTHITKVFIALLFTGISFSSCVNAQEQKNGLIWYTDINQAYELSTKSHKPVFAFFTGSDWCGWCHKLERDVFDKPGFKAWAQKNVILLELDFPRYKKLPDELAKQNDGLQQFFNVQGYPTIWIFNMTKGEGKNKYSIAGLGSLGYPQSPRGKEEATFLQDANKILKNK